MGVKERHDLTETNQRPVDGPAVREQLVAACVADCTHEACPKTATIAAADVTAELRTLRADCARCGRHAGCEVRP